MDTAKLYDKILALKAQKKQFILVLTKATIKQLATVELPEANIDDINIADMWFAGVHVYLGLMDKIIITAGEIWLE